VGVQLSKGSLNQCSITVKKLIVRIKVNSLNAVNSIVPEMLNNTEYLNKLSARE
jgi:hypothetical protein